MKNLFKLILFTSALITFSKTALASHQGPKDQISENAMVKCDSVTGIFLQEWIEGERQLNSFIKLKDLPSPINYTDQIESYFESNTPNSNLEIGCLQSNEGVAIRYKTEDKVSTIIQIDNDGRIQVYPETSSFQIDVRKSFLSPVN